MSKTTNEIETQAMTETEATEEALRLFIRKMRRLHTDAFIDVMTKMPEAARTALEMADQRADTRRLTGGTMVWPASPFEDVEDEDQD